MPSFFLARDAMKYVERSRVCPLTGKDVYLIPMVDQCTWVCCNCKKPRGNCDGNSSYDGLDNLMAHVCCHHGCGPDGGERKLFKKDALLQIGDLPLIQIGNYRPILPFRSLQEPIAAGVARVLDDHAQGLYEDLRAADQRYNAQSKHYTSAWDRMVRLSHTQQRVC